MLEILRKYRIIVIEDTLELAVDPMRKLGYNIERMKTRSVITRIEAELPPEEALRTGLRLGESVLIVGEVRGSIRGDEEILVVENGLMKRVPIKDLEGKDIKKLLVPTLDKNFKISLAPITSFIKHPPRQKLFKIVTRTGREVTVTEDHSLFTTNGFDVLPIETSKLKVGDKILIPSNLPYGFNDIDTLNLLELLPEFRVVNAEPYIRRAISKLKWKKASKTCGVRDIYVYLRKGTQHTNIPVETFKILMKESGVDYSLDNLRVKKGSSNTLPAILPLTEEFCKFLGYYISEGYITNTSVTITNSNEEIIEDVISISKKLFGVKPYVREVKGLGKSKQIQISSAPLAHLLLKLGCGRIGKEKRVPPLIYGLSQKKICAFLTGLFSGDGSFTSTNKSGNEIEFVSSSKKLVEDVAYLLLTLGIVAKIRREKVWKVKLRRRDDIKKFLQKINFVNSPKKSIIERGYTHSAVNVVTFDKKDLENIKLPRKYRHLKRFCRCSKYYLQELVKDKKIKWDEKIVKFANGEFYLDEIKEIKEIKLDPPEPVYDLSINPSENFIGGFGGIILHNSEALALFEAMRIGALANVVAGTVHAESPYGVYDRIVHDLGVPPTSFKACDLIVICSMLRSPDGLHRFRRVVELTEVRKHWKEDPEAEGGFVPLMQYSAKEDRLKPTDVLIDGESWVLNEIAKKVREWHGAWDLVWDNILLRAKIKETMVDFALKLNRPEILEADWSVEANEMFHLICDKVREEVGSLDSKLIYERWLDWFKRRLK
jgi:intein/homing endonuclease